MVLNPKMYCVCLNHGYLNSVKQSVRSISSGGTLLSKSHYDALGLTPKATQSEVKSAYYKLSMQHHPDKNEGSEAASQQFRDISAAYEVLGNVKLRKLYDKGLYDTTPRSPSHPEERQMQFYRSREKRTRPPPPDGRTPIYDFDEWSKQHYGATFAKKIKHQQKLRRSAVMNESYNSRKQQDGFFVVLLLLVALMLYSVNGVEDHDRPKPIYKKTAKGD